MWYMNKFMFLQPLDNDDDVCDDDNDDHDDDKLTIIMKWLKVLPWKGSRS